MPAKIIDHCRKGNQGLPSGKNEILRTALEGLALKYREVHENLRIMTGRSLDTIHLVGGGSKNELLNQMTADATGCNVVAGPVEATSVGNLLVQMIADGELASLAEGRELVAKSFEPKSFEPHTHDRWTEAHQRMQMLKR